MSANRFDHISKTINDYYDYLIEVIENILKTGQALGDFNPSLDHHTTAIEILAKIEGLIMLSSLYKKMDLLAIKTTLYESLFINLSNQRKVKKRKKKDFNFKPFDLG
ncbi:MAG: hypothetical protein FH751_03140 [Firmicutes bacterium]|nr:hypothetical protein [Bacillota bacterium]